MDKFLTGPMCSAPEEQVTASTEAMDRGGLEHINEKVWSFLVALTPILNRVERAGGSVLHEEVLCEVKSDVVLALWDEIIKDKLTTEENDILLKNFLHFYVDTWGQGVRSRRLNEVEDIQRDKVAFRASLLSR